MTLHALNGRLAKLEAQSAPPDLDALTKGRTLIVWRRRKVDTTRIRLLSMSPSERQAWIEETRS